jgi:hypothetical protein
LGEIADRNPLEQQSQTRALADPEARSAQGHGEHQNDRPVSEGEQPESGGGHEQAGRKQGPGPVAIAEPPGPAAGADRGQGVDEQRAGDQWPAGA